MNQSNKMLVFFLAAAAIAVISILAAIPSQRVSAIEAGRQDIGECVECHEQASSLWDTSHHKEVNVSCVVCHKLADSGGIHPDDAKFTVESEETTCLVCHAEVAGENIAGQLVISRHGEVGLTCISCHEQHSQGLKLSDGSRIVCENCHKSVTSDMVGSTHFAAGLSCVNCHMGEDKNHTLVVAVETCGDCHSDLHDANRMLEAGLEIKKMDVPEAMVEETPEPAEAEDTLEPVTGGINMPSWTLVFAGMLIGGVIAWALVGRDPGSPSNGE